MPVVPRANPNRVATRPVPGTRVSPNAPPGAFGVPAGVDLSPVVAFAEQVATRERERTERTALLAADNQLAALERDIWSRAQRRRGEDALGATDEIAELWQKGYGAIEGTVRSERVREAVRARAQQRLSGLLDRGTQYADAEYRKYTVQTRDAALSLRFDDALENFNVPERRTQAITEAKAIIRDIAASDGLSDEVRQSMLDDWTGKVHAGIVSALVTKEQDREAAAYYKQVKAEVPGVMREKIEAVLESGSRLGTAQRLKDEILATDPDITVTAARAIIAERLVKEPETRREAEREVEHALAIRDRQRDAAYDDTFRNAADIVEKGGTLPAPLRESLHPRDRRALDSWRQQMAEGKQPETDWAIYYGLVAAAADDSQAFAAENLLRYRHQLGDTEFKELARLQRSAGAGGNDAELRGFLTTTANVNDAIESSSLFPAPAKRNKDEKEAYVELRREIDAKIRAAKEAKGGKPLSVDEEQQIIDRTLIRTVFVRRPWLPDPERAFSDVKESDRGRVYVPIAKIPLSERTQIENFMRSLGIPNPTEADIENAYGRLRLDGRPLGSLDEASARRLLLPDRGTP